MIYFPCNIFVRLAFIGGFMLSVPLEAHPETTSTQTPPPGFSGMMPGDPIKNNDSEYQTYHNLFNSSENTQAQRAIDDQLKKNPLASPTLGAKSGNQYSWYYRENLNIAPLVTLPETGYTLLLPNLQIQDSGWYKAHLILGNMFQVFDYFQLEVLNAPIITQEPTDQHLVAGETLNLSVSADGGTPPLFYQWYKDEGSGFQQIGIGDTLQIQNTDAGNQGTYKCIVVDSALPTALTRDSAAVNVTVLEISDSPPTELTIETGNNHILAYILSGGDVSTPGYAPSYNHLWEYMPLSSGTYTVLPSGFDNTFAISNASESTPLPDGHQGYYRYTVSDNSRSLSRTVAVYVNSNPILIPTQPTSAGAYVGTDHTFSVDANRQYTPTEALQFTWRYQVSLADLPTPITPGSDIQIVSTNTHSELVLNNLLISQSGYYTCQISTFDPSPIMLSTIPAHLDVGQPLSLTLQPTGGIFHTGDVHPRLTAQSSGGVGEVSYQWWHQSGAGTVTVGGNTPTLDLTPLAQEHTGFWYCVVQDEGIGTAPSITPTVLTSDTVELTVAPAMTINTPVTPALQKLPNGSSITLLLNTTNLGGQAPHTFQWFRSTGNTLIVGENSPSLSLTQLNQSDTDLYYCRIEDSIGGANGAVMSAPADVRVAAPLQITYQPSTVEGEDGQYLMIEVVAEGGLASLESNSPYTYAWEKMDGQAKGLLPVNTAYLEFNPLTVNDVGTYICTVS